jgi:hypothetical protein
LTGHRPRSHATQAGNHLTWARHIRKRLLNR